jgi:hypothetical protein
LNKVGAIAIRQGAYQRKLDVQPAKELAAQEKQVAKLATEEKKREAKALKDLKAAQENDRAVRVANNGDAPENGPPPSTVLYCGSAICGTEILSKGVNCPSQWKGCCGNSCTPTLWMCNKKACLNALAKHITLSKALDFASIQA